MTSESKVLRRDLVDTGEPASKHSLNQRKMHYAIENERKVFGTSKKQLRSERRKFQDREPNEDFSGTIYFNESDPTPDYQP